METKELETYEQELVVRNVQVSTCLGVVAIEVEPICNFSPKQDDGRLITARCNDPKFTAELLLYKSTKEVWLKIYEFCTTICTNLEITDEIEQDRAVQKLLMCIGLLKI